MTASTAWAARPSRCAAIAPLCTTGTLAGSATDLMGCFRVAVRDMDIPSPSAVKAASCNPARAIGLEGERGTLAAGAVADIVLLDEELEIKQVVLRGTVL